MIRADRSDSRVVRSMFQKIADLFTLADYDRAKHEATSRIVSRQSRGNISAQDGWYMTKDELDELSARADTALARLRRAFRLSSKK